MYVKARLWIVLFSIGFLLLTACSENRVNDKEVFLWYAEQIGFKLPKGKHSVIIVPTSSCSGCRKAAVDYGDLHKDEATVIVSGNIASDFDNRRIVVDDNSLCDNLNWSHSNVIEVSVNNGEVFGVKSYDALESIKRFAGIDVSAIENCTEENCRITK